MPVRVAINGFGRIGRALYRAWFQRHLSAYSGVEIVAVNDVESPEQLAYLLQHDSVYRRFLPHIKYEEQHQQLRVAQYCLPITCHRDIPAEHWAQLGVDWVVDASGAYRAQDRMRLHVASGAKRVLITAPTEAADVTVVAGVNDDQFQNQTYVSAASCTTQAMAAVLQPLLSDRSLSESLSGIESGVESGVEIESVMMTEIHASTLDQPVLDTVHQNPVRGRAGAFNMVPTLTTGDRAIGQVLPELAGKVKGYSMRVPVPNGACLDLTIALSKPVTEEHIKALFQSAAEQPNAILGVTEHPFVSSDVTESNLSAVIDLNHVRVNGRQLQLLAWYDNEWGYVSRVLDFLKAQVVPDPTIEQRPI